MPLVPQDEALCHQLPTTFDHVSQSDLRWTERVVVYGANADATVSVMTGLARYPNRNVTDAYVMVTVGDVAHVARFSRELASGGDTLDSWGVGPYRYRVVEPLRSVEVTIAANDEAISGQLTFDGAFPAYEQTPAFFRTRGRIQEDARRYYQSGRARGWFEVDGERIEIDESWTFGRDHSWGTRRGGGGGSLGEGEHLQPPEVPDGVLYFMGIFPFDDELVHFAQRETATGSIWLFEGDLLQPLSAGGAAAPIDRVEHDLTFRDDLRVVSGGTFTVHGVDDSTRRITLEPLAGFWPGLAGYDTYHGYASGMWRGDGWSDGFTVDLGDAAALAPVTMLSETFVRVSDDRGRVATGLVEMVFMGANERYGYEGW